MKSDDLVKETTIDNHKDDGTETIGTGTQRRRPFVEPELVERGDLADVTAGAFGTFSPGP